jgi:hypothetical protein
MNTFKLTCLSLLATTSALVGQVIDTTPRDTDVLYWGPGGGTPYYGQSFTTPVGYNELSSFTFSLDDISGSTGSFVAKLAQWNPGSQTIIGAPIWTSAATSLQFNQGYVDYTFSVGASVTAGSSYLFYAEALSGDSYFTWAGRAANVYAGGSFFFNNGSEGSTWSTWSVPDSAFRAVFSNGAGAVPEPSTYGLIAAAGLLGLVALKRRKA